MRAFILAGGKGTRLCKETQTKPKPMVEIGGKYNLQSMRQVNNARWKTWK